MKSFTPEITKFKELSPLWAIAQELEAIALELEDDNALTYFKTSTDYITRIRRAGETLGELALKEDRSLALAPVPTSEETLVDWGMF